MRRFLILLGIAAGVAAVALATGYRPVTVQENMGVVIPRLVTSSCTNSSVSATTSHVMSSSLVPQVAYDLSTDDYACRFEYKASGDATAADGSYIGAGQTLAGYPDNARLVVYCKGATVFSACPRPPTILAP